MRFQRDEQQPSPVRLMAMQMVMRGESREAAAHKLASTVSKEELSAVLDDAYGGAGALDAPASARR